MYWQSSRPEFAKQGGSNSLVADICRNAPFLSFVEPAAQPSRTLTIFVLGIIDKMFDWEKSLSSFFCLLEGSQMRLAGTILFLMFVPIASVLSFQRYPPKKDHELIQGTWEVTEFVDEGESTSAETRKKIRFVFKGDIMQITGPGGIGDRKYSFTLDQSKMPKAINTVPLTGVFKGMVGPAIYELDIDTLKLCIPNGETKDRPTEFKSPKGSELGLFVLKRQKQK